MLKEGLYASLKRIQRLMKLAGLASIIQKKYTPYKQSKELVLERDNILEQDFSTTSINQKWVSDITYIHVQEEGWCYLASVMDLHSKKIIGYHFSKQMTTDIIVQALKNAYISQRPKDEVILHTDLGSQYTSLSLIHISISTSLALDGLIMIMVALGLFLSHSFLII